MKWFISYIFVDFRAYSLRYLHAYSFRKWDKWNMIADPSDIDKNNYKIQSYNSIATFVNSITHMISNNTVFWQV